MEEIRLTCGGCNKRYRLPGNAVGYFRCRKCDLVMAIPATAGNSTAPVPVDSRRDTIRPSQGAEGADEFDVIDEIVIDPSTNELVHRTSDSSSSTGFDEVAVPAALPGGLRQYRGHIKQEASFSPADAASIFVGVCMMLGGWFAIVLQLLKEGEIQSRSMVALVLGLMAALVGVGLLAFGLRKNKMILLPTAIIGGLASILLFRASIMPPSDKPQEQLANNNSGIGEFDPGESRFSLDRRKEEAAKRQAKLDGLADEIESLKSREPVRRPESKQSKQKSQPRRPTPERANVDDENPFEKNADSTANRTSQGPAFATGKFAREIERLWTSVKPDHRHKIIDDMEEVVKDGLEDSNGDEREYWEMFEDRLQALDRFGDGKWVTLDFKHGLTGWHTSDQSSVSVESEDTVKVNSGGDDRGRSILSSTNMFYGPITVQAQLELEAGGAGANAPQIGLVFSSGKPDAAISDEDCVVLFDSDFRQLRSGTFGSKEQAVSLSGLSPEIKTAEPIELQINVCRGYIQVFANKQLLVEKFDRSITDAHSLRLVVLGGSGSAGSFRVRDWQARRWKAGRPPGKNAFVEEDLMYLSDAVGEFKEIGWYYYRLALAQFGARKFVKAAESARTAERLGIPHKDLAIIFAVENELEKKYIEASREYALIPNDQEIAKAWHAWFVLTNPDNGIRGGKTVDSLSDDFYPDRWVVNRIKAALAASRGQFSIAAQLVADVAREVPLDYRGATNKQLQSYEADTIYVRDRGRVPFYHGLKVRIQPDRLQYDSDDRD